MSYMCIASIQWKGEQWLTKTKDLVLPVIWCQYNIFFWCKVDRYKGSNNPCCHSGNRKCKTAFKEQPSIWVLTSYIFLFLLDTFSHVLWSLDTDEWFKPLKMANMELKFLQSLQCSKTEECILKICLHIFHHSKECFFLSKVINSSHDVYISSFVCQCQVLITWHTL